ncbi:CoA transferase [Glaciimonas sp. CA11.2]|uniref:CaiB/BaiF CoA transferase family protein n=1 Tax=unclassified Glaciimonas TaxID=2644401 RepID=UPI002AB45BC7|nr:MULTISPECIES: CoA transferase [unclassified Glaciimonas]MDY7547108.1 CoA transferase [Glaciimonas sp. CA11.2]MEB0011048.1 CoA transferase [Glaciimonas sp. Cout2]MEB0081275.1 CoA transferase [Glaciimonas sp. Gout2]MEB0162001.1 CoA transferase [Glaciimonas sp. CA11.2]
MTNVGGPLAGIRIIDMTSVLMGPFATQILADYGADVIKIESEDGDLFRLAGAMRNPKMGALFLQTNRNKRSVVLDAKTEEGRSALLALCEDADVFVSNIRPSALKRLGMGYEDVKARNPAIIYASLVGYGQQGPYKDRPAYDDLIQGISAIPSLISRTQDSKPQYVPITMADKVAGLSAAHAILAALVYKERTGLGQSIEVPMFEIMTQFVLTDHIGGHCFEPTTGPAGYNRLLAPDRRPYETKDGFISLLVYTDEHWRKFFQILGRPEEYASSPIFNDHATRTRSYDEVYRYLAAVVKTKTTDEWQTALEKYDIPWAPMHSIEGLINDPHLKSVDLIKTMEHPTEGKIRMIAPPITFSLTPCSVYRLPPQLGEHTDEVFKEFGITPKEKTETFSDVERS